MIRKICKWIGIIVVTPIFLFLMVAGLLYVPALQNFLVDKATRYASQSMGMKVEIAALRLGFPLDLVVKETTVITEMDTLLRVEELRITVQLLPLFRGRAEVDEVSLSQVWIDSQNLLDGISVKGDLGYCKLIARGVDIVNQHATINHFVLNDAHIDIALQESTPEDTLTSAPLNWVIELNRLEILKSALTLRTLGDTMRVATHINKAILSTGIIDLAADRYEANRFILNADSVWYDLMHEPHVKGLDYNHIALNQISITADSILFDTGELQLQVNECALREKSGLNLTSLVTKLHLTPDKIVVPHLSLRTSDSSIDAQVSMDFAAFDSVNAHGRFYLRLMAEFGKQDILTILSDAPKEFAHHYPNHPLTIKALIDGNAHSMQFNNIEAHLKSAFSLSVRGSGKELLNSHEMVNKLDFTATTHNLKFLLAYIDTELLNRITIPTLTAKGNCRMKGNNYGIGVTVSAPQGKVDLNATFDAQRFAYNAKLKIDSLQLHDFLPNDSLYFITASVDATGVGNDILSSKSWSNIIAQVDRFDYGKHNLGEITAKANLKQGVAQLAITTQNELIEATMDVYANLNSKKSNAQFGVTLDNVDLHALGVIGEPLNLALQMQFEGATNLKEQFELMGDVTNIQVKTSDESFRMKDIGLHLSTQKDSTFAYINAATLAIRLNATGGYEKLIDQATHLIEVLQTQIENKLLDEKILKELLPSAHIRVEAGKDNPLYNMMAMSGYKFGNFSLNINTSPQQGINGNISLYALDTGGALIDTTRIAIVQDSIGLMLKGEVCNSKKNPKYIFNLLVEGFLRQNSAGINLLYLDEKGEEGLRLGMNALLEKEGIRLHFTPANPIIAYRNFRLNKNNFIFIDNNQRIEADVDLLADDQTHLKLFTLADEDLLQDISVSISKLNLDELTSVIPYAPKIKGFLYADMRLVQTPSEVSVLADLNVANMVVEGNSIGNISIESVYLPNENKSHYIDTQVTRNGEKVMSLSGTYFDNEKIDAKAELTRFPLDLLNGFVADQTVALAGRISGSTQIDGSLDRLKINGEIALDSVHLMSAPYGMHLRFTNTPIRVTNSNLMVDKLNIFSKSGNPLTVDGNVDFSDFSKIKLNINAFARNFEVINAEYTKQSLVYGKVYVDFGTRITGTPDNLSIRGGVSVLGTTDVTYVLKDSPLSVDERLGSLVTFVNFADTVAVANSEKHNLSAIDMQVSLKIEEAARLNCDLSPDRQSYLNLEGGGTLAMSYSPQGDLILTGRYTVNEGKMKYSLPVISLKDFTVKSGSYIEFTGNPENPILNIAATERVRTSVTENDVSRSVAFDVGVKITQALNNMGLEFTLEAPEDMQVQNQLASMGVEERGKMAVTMLATGMYLGSASNGTSGKLNVNNALNSFLQNEIASIAGSALKTIDVSLGMESGTSANGSNHTDYSFKFAKRFWGNRVSFIIGGKVSTGENLDNQEDNFIDNVSLEYRLDKGATRYVRLFYDNNKYDVLEGRIMETGGGLVLRKKVNRLSELFIFRERKPNTVIKKEEEEE